MIIKSTTGKNFRGLANYLENREKMEWKEVHNLAGESKNHYVKMMNDCASLSTAKKPVYHLSISYAESDNPSKEMMIEDGKKTLEKLGLNDHQAVFVAHNDTKQKHMHVMINRINSDTEKAWSPWHDRYKIRGIAREIERERGYEKTRVRNPERSLELSNGELHQLKENGLEKIPLKVKMEMADFREVVRQAESWEGVFQEAEYLGCTIERKGRGAVIEEVATGKQLKLSRIGRECGLGRLEQRFGRLKDYEQVRELLPENEIRRSFSDLVKTGSAEAGKNFGRALKYSRDFSRAVKGLTALASSSNPVAGVAKFGLNMTQKISQQLEQERGMER